MAFINVGFGNIVNSEKITAVITPDSAPCKRLVQTAKEENRVIDATQGRRTKGVIITENNQVVLSALIPDTIAARLRSATIGKENEAVEE